MEQMKNQQTKDSQEKKHSENLMQQMIRFRKISANNVFAPQLQSWSVSLSGALAMHFLSSPERWIRL